MNWNKLETIEELDLIANESHEQTVLIFKHSTTCTISATALQRLERNWSDADLASVKPYYLDLLRFRPISNAITAKFGVEHQSPQVIIMRGGKAVYNASHMGISYGMLREVLAEKLVVKAK
jgi:bacillithiol system protein YtxJ